ncbi:MAG: hypothetical protein EOR73_28415 [Mesorhizobium sp.]|nr:MAG: hypothetical protein EOR73_28415 [Mesorhizobium sp.]
MSDDGQGTELEVGVAPDGFTAKIKSRMLSALDRFSGNKVAKRGLADERHVLIERTKHHQEAKAIEALGDLAVERIKGDPALVEQLLESHFPGMIRKQENVAGSLEHATEQLKLLPPPAAAETEDASDEVDPDWLNVWEGHAEKASSDRMRNVG